VGIAFSTDPAQKYFSLADGANERSTSSIALVATGSQLRRTAAAPGISTRCQHRHRLEGRPNTTETYAAMRFAKVVYKGLAPVTNPNQGTVWPTNGHSRTSGFAGLGTFAGIMD